MALSFSSRQLQFVRSDMNGPMVGRAIGVFFASNAALGIVIDGLAKGALIVLLISAAVILISQLDLQKLCREEAEWQAECDVRWRRLADLYGDIA